MGVQSFSPAFRRQLESMGPKQRGLPLLLCFSVKQRTILSTLVQLGATAYTIHNHHFHAGASQLNIILRQCNAR